jgi:serine protease AprX
MKKGGNLNLGSYRIILIMMLLLLMVVHAYSFESEQNEIQGVSEKRIRFGENFILLKGQIAETLDEDAISVAETGGAETAIAFPVMSENLNVQQPEQKIGPELLEIKSQKTAEKIPVIIKLKDGTVSKEEIESDIENKEKIRFYNSLRGPGFKLRFVKPRTRVKEELRIINSVTAEVPADLIDDLAEIENVKEIIYDKPVKAHLTESVGIINATRVWQLSDNDRNPIMGTNITIAIIDTGIDYTHPAFGSCTQEEFLAGTCEKVIGGYDFSNNDNNPYDDNGHGTHCAGIAAGNGIVKGVAPNAKLYAYKVLSSSGSGSYSQVIQGIERATDPDGDQDYSDHVDVISLSLGAPGNPDDEVSEAVDTAFARGVVAVVSAGNSGPGESTIDSPGCARDALTVGATCKPSQVGSEGYCNEVVASFSSRGPTSTGDSKPDVMAPGVKICSAQRGDSYLDQGYSQCVDNDYVQVTGTSMSAPHVAGAAALILQAHPEYTPEDVKSAIMGTATDLGYGANVQGAGLLDTYSAIGMTNEILVDPSYETVYDSPDNQYYYENISLTLTNLLGTSVDVNITDDFDTDGINITLYESRVSITPGSISIVNISVIVDNYLIKSGNTVQGNIIFTTENSTLRIPISVRILERARFIEEDVELGIEDLTTEIWETNYSFTLRNLMADQNITFNLSVRMDSEQAGILLNLSEEQIMSISGANTTFNLSVSVNNSLVSNNLYTGKIYANSSQQDLTASFTIIKYNVLQLDFDAEPWISYIHDRNETTYWATYPGRNHSEYLPASGLYDLIVIFWDEPKQIVIREAINVSGVTSITVNQTSANLNRSIRALDRKNNSLQTKNGAMAIIHSPSSIGLEIYGDLGRDNSFSDFSSNYTVSNARQKIESRNAYLIYDSFSGITSSKVIKRTVDDYQKKSISYFPNKYLKGMYNLIWFLHDDLFSTGFASGGSGNYLRQPFIQDVYHTPLNDSNNYYNVIFLSAMDSGPDSGFWGHDLLYESPLYALHQNQTARYMDYIQYDLSPIQSDIIYSGLGPEFPFMAFNNGPTSLTFGAQKGLSLNFFLSQSRDYFSHNPPYLEPYTLYDNDDGVVEESLIGYGETSLSAPGKYTFSVEDRVYPIERDGFRVKVNYTFNTSLSDNDPPAITDLYLQTGGVMSDVLDEDKNNVIYVTVNPDGGSILSFNASYYNLTWRRMSPAEIASSGGVINYSILIPGIIPDNNMSISLSSTDSSGNSVSFVFNIPTDHAPNLQCYPSWLDFEPFNSTHNRINLSIKNSGRVTSGQNHFRVSYNYSQDSLDYETNFSMQQLSPGNSLIISVYQKIRPGENLLVLESDFNGTLTEIRETDNVMFFSDKEFEVMIGSDTEHASVKGQERRIFGNIENLHWINKSNVSINVNVTDPLENNIWMGEINISSFKGSEIRNFNLSYTPSYDGIHTISVHADHPRRLKQETYNGTMRINDFSVPRFDFISIHNQTYGKSWIFINVTANKTLENLSVFSGLTTHMICDNCKSGYYNLTIAIDGDHNISVIGTDYNLNEIRKKFSVVVDTTSPVINSVYPLNQSYMLGQSHQNFTINFDEMNLYKAVLYHKLSNETVYLEQEFLCQGGLSSNCSTALNLTGYISGSTINAYFEIFDNITSTSSGISSYIIDRDPPATNITIGQGENQAVYATINVTLIDVGSGISHSEIIIRDITDSTNRTYNITSSAGITFKLSENHAYGIIGRGVDNIGNRETKILDDLNFTSNLTAINYNLTLYDGWNLVSVPMILLNQTAKNFSGYFPSGTLFWKYNASEQYIKWKFYSDTLPSELNTIEGIDPASGYWIYHENTGSYLLSGYPSGRFYCNFSAEWNLAGFPASRTYSPESYYALFGNVTHIWAHYANETYIKWKFFSLDLPPELNTITKFVAGRGYWIYMTQERGAFIR